jgi:hypothetical protein
MKQAVGLQSTLQMNPGRWPWAGMKQAFGLVDTVQFSGSLSVAEQEER